MDTKTLNLDFGNVDNDKLRETLRRIGEFIANFEIAMSEWKHDIETTIYSNQNIVNTQLQHIQDVVSKFEKLSKDFADEVSIAQFRIAVKSALEQGKEHVRALENLTRIHSASLEVNNQEFQNLAKKSFDRLDRASAYTIKNISEAISSFRITDFQRLAEQSCEIVEEVSTDAITRLKKALRRLHWKNIGLTVAITIFATFTICLYLEDEMPWEIHKQVVAQRRAGQAIINAWPTLSEEERQRIVEHSNRAFF
jgi:hypothetical protein